MTPPRDAPILLLFESGATVEVQARLFPAPEGSSRPIDAFLVTDCGPQMQDAALRGASAAHGILQEQGLNGASPLTISFDLAGLPAGQAAIGGSGGLAFALATAQALLTRDLGPLAASGEILSAHGAGPVGRVAGIEEKLRAASDRLPAGSPLFYPEANDDDIGAGLRQQVEAAGCRMVPVENVEQALAFFGHGENAADASTAGSNRKHIAPSIAGAVLLLGSGVLGWAMLSGHAPNQEATMESGGVEKPAMALPKPEARPSPAAKRKAMPAPTGAMAQPSAPDQRTPAAPVPSKTPPPVRIAGDGELATAIAELLETRLRESPPDDSDTSTLVIDGKIEVVAISEQRLESGLYSRVDAVLNVAPDTDDGRFGTARYHASDEGPGPTRQRVSGIVWQLAQQLRKDGAGDTYPREMIDGDRGFD